MENLTEGFRLAPQQQKLWNLQQRNFAFCAQCAILLEGNLDAVLLRQAVQDVVERHEILRTQLHHCPSIKSAFQVISESGSCAWQEITLEDTDDSGVSGRLTELLREEWERLQTPGHGQILHAALLAANARSHYLLLGLPALYADSQSLNILVEEIRRSYAARASGDELKDEVTQFVQFSEWQNELLEDESAVDGREFWSKHFDMTLPSLKLPFELQKSESATFESQNGEVINNACQTSASRDFAPQSLALAFDSAGVAKLETLAQRCKSSTQFVLQTCWQVLLGRITGRSEFVVGVVADGRKFEELGQTLGLLAKYLPLQCKWQGDLEFGSLVGQVAEATHDLNKWQEYFIWQRQAAIADEVTEESPFFPVCFDFRTCLNGPAAAGVTFCMYEQRAFIDRFKLLLSCTQYRQTLHVAFHYDANSFREADIRRLAGEFQTLVESACDRPEASTVTLNILTSSERQRLMREFNRTRVAYSSTHLVHQLFEQQVADAPGNEAVVFEDRRLTYAELNARANQLANYLHRLGVGPEARVGLWLERSLEAVVVMLGILKAGGAYVPLDPSMPKERVSFMLEDARPLVLLTERRLEKLIPASGSQIICLDQLWEALELESEENPLSCVAPENPVYVIFTSGSTGRPKGVTIEHRQLFNYVRGIGERLQLSRDASFATVSTFAADLGNTSIFGALCTGRPLHIMSRERVSDPNALANYLHRERVDCLKIVPTHLNSLLSAAHPERIIPRQQLIFGGEACQVDLIEKVRKLNPQCRLLNHYGPTETTVGVLTYIVEPEASESRAAILPLGKPLANTHIYLLDAHLQPVPIWTVGELYVGGECLARGYINRPELTAEKFIPDPFGGEPGARMYRTGDLAHYRPDGNIEFLGRVDQQVKIRGFRIELGEVEAVMRQHPQVREGVVIAREDTPGERRLVAYFVPRQRVAPVVNELRAFLKERLPEYMVPSTFVIRDSLPLTAQGKLDRKALPAPDSARPDMKVMFVPPRDALEVQLAQIWEEIFNSRPIGVTDNFFELGGHSLLVVRLMAMIEKQFGQELPISVIFQGATIEHLAKQLRQQCISPRRTPLVEVRTTGSNLPLFCVHPTNGSALCYFEISQHLGPQQPLYGFQSRGLEDEQEPFTRLEEMAEHYVEVMREIQPHGPYLLCGWSMGGAIAFEMARQLQECGAEIALLTLIDSSPPSSHQSQANFSDAELLSALTSELSDVFGARVSISYEELLGLGPEEQLNYILESAMNNNAMPPSAEARLRRLLRILKTNLRAMQGYTPGQYDGQIQYFQAREVLPGRPVDAAQGWYPLATQGVEVHEVPGNHLSLLLPPNVQVVAELLKATICVSLAGKERAVEVF